MDIIEFINRNKRDIWMIIKDLELSNEKLLLEKAKSNFPILKVRDELKQKYPKKQEYPKGVKYVIEVYPFDTEKFQIAVSGETYPIKEKLKEKGYRWYVDAWVKTVDFMSIADEINKMLEMLQNAEVIIK
uniref:Uncharacterized protein n=1 Tax=Thermodesulfobacterium geofontis TaxID=1295609 RepID=A0A7C4NUD3_9BACT